MASRPGVSTPPLLFVGGAGRSGSTVLECMLGEVDGVTVLGEVNHLWERGIRNDELCACGAHFSSCPFWADVGDRAFGGWAAVDLERVETLKDAVDRQRRLPSSARRRPSTRFGDLALEYADLYRRIYVAAAEVAGADVVVDSSKVAPTAMALTHHPGIDMRVLHIVRDARGVAHSWSKVVARPETRGELDMPRMSTLGSTAQWLAHNLAIGGVVRRGVPLARLRYEDLVQDPAAELATAWGRLGLPGTCRLPVSADGVIELRGTHSVAGNPMRFKRGPVPVRVDDAWREEMPAARRRAVGLLAWPALRHYGYTRGS